MTQQQTFEGFDAPIDNKAQLQAKFIVPPFSVLDTRQGYWQERKRLWLSLGIQSELGRGETSGAKLVMSDTIQRLKPSADQALKHAKAYKAQKALDKIMKDKPNHSGVLHKGETGTDWDEEYNGGDCWKGGGTSIFDPLLCELIYKWFCPEQGAILDPFAGGSVRGIVASTLGYDYTGIDLSQAQIEANRQQAQEITPNKQPEWIAGDSHRLDTLLPQDEYYDLVFTCPPYHDLEQYTDDMDDLSNMSWGTFKQKYNEIIAECILKLKPNRFACFVVSEIRDGVGGYKGLVPYTIDCFNRNGARYYNELIMVNVAGSLPIRIASQFAYRKIGRTHQNILVFYKGDINLIPKHFKDIDSDISLWSKNE